MRTVQLTAKIEVSKESFRRFLSDSFGYRVDDEEIAELQSMLKDKILPNDAGSWGGVGFDINSMVKESLGERQDLPRLVTPALLLGIYENLPELKNISVFLEFSRSRLDGMVAKVSISNNKEAFDEVALKTENLEDAYNLLMECKKDSLELMDKIEEGFYLNNLWKKRKPISYRA